MAKAMIGKILRNMFASPVQKKLRYLPETNEWQNIDGYRSIEILVRDRVTGNDFETSIAPGEKVGLQEGMELRYVRSRR